MQNISRIFFIYSEAICAVVAFIAIIGFVMLTA
jgi:hypothetical protein